MPMQTIAENILNNIPRIISTKQVSHKVWIFEADFSVASCKNIVLAEQFSKPVSTE